MVEARLGDLEDELAEQDKTVAETMGYGYHWVSIFPIFPIFPYSMGITLTFSESVFGCFSMFFLFFSGFWKTIYRHDMKDQWIFGGFNVFLGVGMFLETLWYIVLCGLNRTIIELHGVPAGNLTLCD